MRRIIVSLVALSLFGGAAATQAVGQTNARKGRDQTAEDTRNANRERRKMDKEMQRNELPLPELANTGPCPYVKVLYDAARDIEFVGGRQASSAVAYSGEIQGLTATCRYKDNEPIVVDVNVTFALGKGPQATASTKEYGYWVAVTDRNRAVLNKEQFGFTADFSRGERVLVFERIANITIPRANDKVSGENFEILVGFNVTPQMAEFNRQGTRFVVNATGQQTAVAAPPQ